MTEQHCISCKRRTTNLPNVTKFLCPNCGKFEILRCGNCRAIGAKYVCEKCNFEGPN